MAAIFNAENGGLMGEGMTDREALDAARDRAIEHDEDVHLSDSEGEWIVTPDGACTPVALDEGCADDEPDDGWERGPLWSI